VRYWKASVFYITFYRHNRHYSSAWWYAQASFGKWLGLILAIKKKSVFHTQLSMLRPGLCKSLIANISLFLFIRLSLWICLNSWTNFAHLRG
jgi:hypothetical protein